MTRKLLQVAILLAVCAWLANACKTDRWACRSNSDCYCTGYCRKFPPFKNGLCVVPPVEPRRDVIDDEVVQGSNEDDFIENEEDDSFDFDEEGEDDESTIIPSTTLPSPIRKPCARGGTFCNPRNHSCCSGRCVQRPHESTFRCAGAGRGWDRTSKTTKPTSTTPVP